MTGPEWMAGLDRWPRALPEFELRRDRAGLLIVDVQNYVARRDCGLSGRFAREYPDEAEQYFDRVDRQVLPNNRRLLDIFRAASRPVVFLAFGAYRSDGLDAVSPRRQSDARQQATEGRPTVFSAGSREHAICEELEPGPNEPVLTKVTSGGFLSTGLDVILRNLGVTDLVITGLLTNGCVESTMNEAADRGYRVDVAEDACASFEPAAHYATLRNFRRLRGLVESSAQIIARLEGRKVAAG